RMRHELRRAGEALVVPRIYLAGERRVRRRLVGQASGEDLEQLVDVVRSGRLVECDDHARLTQATEIDAARTRRAHHIRRWTVAHLDPQRIEEVVAPGRVPKL